jgi:4-hydroxy-tetrahydrodipicolinate reductase
MAGYESKITPMSIRVCVAGATGWIGRPLCLAISRAPELSLVGAVSRSAGGHSLQEILGYEVPELRISPSVTEALHTPADVLVDYTHASAVKEHALKAISQGVNVVIGSSGLTGEDFADIDRSAVENRVGVIAAGNFSITAVLLQRFACQAARYLSRWEIIDYAADTKQDAPSGTARELAFRLAEVRKPEFTVPVEETVGEKHSRGTNLDGSQVHSIRLPGYVISIEAIFGGTDERLSIRHDAGNGTTPYIQGTLLAIRKVQEYSGLIRGLDRIME